MMDLAVPVQFAVHMAEIVADAVNLAAHTVAAEVAVVQFIFDVFEVAADGFEFIARAAATVGSGFIAQVAVPLPKAVDIGAHVVTVVVVVVIAGLKDRGGGEEAGGNAEGEDGLFHKVVFGIVRGETDACIRYSTWMSQVVEYALRRRGRDLA